MATLGSLVSNGVNQLVNSVSGKDSDYSYTTTLEDFLTKFGSAEQKYVDTLDPLRTFEIKFRFFPSGDEFAEGTAASTSFLNQLGSTIRNVANNVTGGLAGSLLNMNSEEWAETRAKFIDAEKINDEKYKLNNTLLEYIMFSNMLASPNASTASSSVDAGIQNFTSGFTGKPSTSSSSNEGNKISTTRPLEIQLGMYVQNITVPKLTMSGAEEINHVFGKTVLPGNVVVSDNNTLAMDILNTRAPLMERIFYPWMKEITLPYWSYKSQPYTTADITIDFSEHCDLKYKFVGCRPSTIGTMQPTQDPSDELTRQIIFNFDYMFVMSKVKTHDDIVDTLLDTVNTGFSTVTTLLGDTGKN